MNVVRWNAHTGREAWGQWPLKSTQQKQQPTFTIDKIIVVT